MLPQSSSILIALLVTFDGLNATESRFILTDAHMMFYVGASFLIAVKFWKRRNMYWYLRQISNTPKATKDISRKRTGSIQWSRMHSWFAAPGDNFMPLYEEVAWCTLLGLACGAAVRCEKG
jgi:dolichyl-phosphate-mannose--protein O-mannosyl transferase